MTALGDGVTLADLEGDPHPVLARLRRAEPVAWLPVLDGWLVTRHDLAVRTMRDGRTFTVDDPRFSTARLVGPSMLSLDGREHARHRAPFRRPFRPAEVRAGYADVVSAEVDRLVSRLAPDGSAELRRGLAGPLAVTVVAAMLGIADADGDAVLAWYDDIVTSVSGLSAGRDLTEAGHRSFASLRTGIEATVDDDRDTLLRSAADDLALPEVVANAAVLMFGGIETTEGMIANALVHLLTHPEQRALVDAEPALLTTAIEESLRLEPAAATVDRYATADVELGGASVRRGDLVTVSITGANRDPAVFADPDRFDVRRANVHQHLAFAHGAHFCLGADLARLEAEVALRAALTRLPGLRLDDQAPRPHGLVFRKPDAVRVRWDT
ncbi:MAG: cytochrome P450 [Streptosporangiales bacterium]|nr:cytochrome P450 [Streptosporangiales bacterium]